MDPPDLRISKRGNLVEKLHHGSYRAHRIVLDTRLAGDRRDRKEAARAELHLLRGDPPPAPAQPSEAALSFAAALARTGHDVAIIGTDAVRISWPSVASVV